MKFLTTKQFDRAVKAIKKKHDKALETELIDKLTKIYTRSLTESDKAHPIKGKHSNNLNDVHISGDQIILYRYDADSDTLVLSAKIHDIVKHSDLSNKETFKEKQGFEHDFDEYIRDIRSSNTASDSSIDLDYIDDWFTDYYNEVISQVICIDDITISKIVDKGDYLIIIANGWQYTTSVPLSYIAELNKILNVHCRPDGVTCSLAADDSICCYNDPDSYGVTLMLEVPLEVAQ